MLERGRVKDEVNPAHRPADSARVPHIADLKLHAAIDELPAHSVLLGLVPAEDPDLLAVALQQA